MYKKARESDPGFRRADGVQGTDHAIEATRRRRRVDGVSSARRRGFVVEPVLGVELGHEVLHRRRRFCSRAPCGASRSSSSRGAACPVRTRRSRRTPGPSGCSPRRRHNQKSRARAWPVRPVHRDARIIKLKVAVALAIQEAHVIVRPVEAGLGCFVSPSRATGDGPIEAFFGAAEPHASCMNRRSETRDLVTLFVMRPILGHCEVATIKVRFREASLTVERTRTQRATSASSTSHGQQKRRGGQTTTHILNVEVSRAGDAVFAAPGRAEFAGCTRVNMYNMGPAPRRARFPLRHHLEPPGQGRRHRRDLRNAEAGVVAPPIRYGWVLPARARGAQAQAGRWTISDIRRGCSRQRSGRCFCARPTSTAPTRRTTTTSSPDLQAYSDLETTPTSTGTGAPKRGRPRPGSRHRHRRRGTAARPQTGTRRRPRTIGPTPAGPREEADRPESTTDKIRALLPALRVVADEIHVAGRAHARGAHEAQHEGRERCFGRDARRGAVARRHERHDAGEEAIPR